MSLYVYIIYTYIYLYKLYTEDINIYCIYIIYLEMHTFLQNLTFFQLFLIAFNSTQTAYNFF